VHVSKVLATEMEIHPGRRPTAGLVVMDDRGEEKVDALPRP
jgi:hypothetical protein